MCESHASDGIRVIVTASARTRANLALHHLLAACRFGARLRTVERENSGAAFGSFWDEVLHNALGVVTLSVAALEGYANELYFEASILPTSLTPAAARQVESLMEREPILKKYDMALALRSGEVLDRGKVPVQDVKILIDLRNAVAHFRPEWFGKDGDHEKLAGQLRGRFQPSPFLPSEPLFLRAWASGSFTSWALRSTTEFLRHFYDRCGMECPLNQFSAQLGDLYGEAL